MNETLPREPQTLEEFLAAAPEEPKRFLSPLIIKRGKAWWRPFLERLAETCNVTEACAVVGVSRREVYRAKKNFPEFKALWEEAEDIAIDSLEREARRRAHEGWLEPVFGKGGPGEGTVQVGVIRKYSDNLLMLLLRSHRPDKFRERLEHTGPNGGPMQFKVVEDG